VRGATTAGRPDTSTATADGFGRPTEPPTVPDPHDHLRPTDGGLPGGVYRVVGTGDPVALLRVADADGRRVHTGVVVRVDREELSAFESVATPGDRGRDPKKVVELTYWTGRVFVGQLAANPLPTVVAVALVAVGAAGDAVGLPDVVAGLLVLLGSLGLGYVASGRAT